MNGVFSFLPLWMIRTVPFCWTTYSRFFSYAFDVTWMGCVYPDEIWASLSAGAAAGANAAVPTAATARQIAARRIYPE